VQRLGSFKSLVGVFVGTVLVFILSGVLSGATWRYGIGCAKSLNPPYIYTDEELESLRGKPLHTTGWSWFYIPARYPGSYQGYPFFGQFTIGWPMTYAESTSGAEGCFDPWIIRTEWYPGGLFVDGVVCAGLGTLLYWLFRLGLSLPGTRRKRKDHRAERGQYERARRTACRPADD
jgi:hypothetical protein